MRRITGLLIIMLATCLVPPSTALAETEQVDVPATFTIVEGKRSTSQCFVWLVAQWKDPEGATAWEMQVKHNGRQETKRLRPPFDDTTWAKFGKQPPTGTHWSRITYFSASAPGRVPSCAGKAGELRAAYSDLKLLVTVETKTKIEGTVKDFDGDPVSGAKVQVRGAGSDRTDDQGFYEVELPDKNRTYRVTPSHSAAEKFSPKRRTVSVQKGKTKKANFKMKAQRTISGRVRLDCEGTSSCSISPVFGVDIKAKGGRSYSGMTDTKGEYKLHVKKGRYRITPKTNVLKPRPTVRTLDLRRSRKRTADFNVCGDDTTTSKTARAAAVGAGLWKTEPDCTDKVEVSWAPASNDLSFNWASIPRCVVVGSPKPVVIDYRVWVFGGPRTYQRIDPRAGNRLILKPDGIDFVFPDTPPSPFLFDGTIRADGTGTVNGIVSQTVPYRERFQKKCTVTLKNVPLKRTD